MVRLFIDLQLKNCFNYQTKEMMERMEIQPFGNEYKSQQVRLIIVFLATLEIISHAVTATVMHLLNFNPPVKAHRVLLWVLCILIGWMSVLAGGFGFGKCSSLCVLVSKLF